VRSNALQVRAFEPADESWLAEMDDLHAARRTVIELLKSGPALRAKAVSIETETGAD
jgi:hypothetical protein